MYANNFIGCIVYCVHIIGDIYIKHTSSRQYQKPWLALQEYYCHFEFHAESCTGISVALALDPEERTQNVYEIVIGLTQGGSTFTLIRDGIDGNIVAQSATPGVLDCHNMHPLWVSWCDGSLIVGKDDVHTNTLLHYSPPQAHNVTMLSIGSYGAATWQYLREQGNDRLGSVVL